MAYTYAKAIDWWAGTTPIPIPEYWDLNKGPQGGTYAAVPHKMDMSGVYELPFGAGRTFLNTNSVLGKVVGGWQLTVNKNSKNKEAAIEFVKYMTSAELQKASWPWEAKDKGIRRYKELTDSTLVVIIAMLLLGGYVALFDFVIINFIHYFTRMH